MSTEKFTTLQELVKVSQNAVKGLDQKLQNADGYLKWTIDMLSSMDIMYLSKDGVLTMSTFAVQDEFVIQQMIASAMEVSIDDELDAEVLQENLDKVEREFVKFDAFLKSYITSACNTMLPLTLMSSRTGKAIRNSVSGREFWETLAKEFKCASGSVAKYQALEALENVKQGNNEKLMAYHTRIMEIVARIQLTGGKVDGDDIRRHFIQGLASHFAATAMSITMIDFTSLSDDINRLLPAEAVYLKNQGRRKLDAQKAKIAKLKDKEKKLNDKKKKKNKERNKAKCPYCQYPGHNEDRCWKKKRDEKSSEDGDDSSKDKPAKNIFSGRGTKAKNNMLSAVVQKDDSALDEDSPPFDVLPNLVDGPDDSSTDEESDDSDYESSDSESDDDCDQTKCLPGCNCMECLLSSECLPNCRCNMCAPDAEKVMLVQNDRDETTKPDLHPDAVIVDSGCTVNIVKTESCCKPGSKTHSKHRVDFYLADGNICRDLTSYVKCKMEIPVYTTNGKIARVEIPGDAWYVPKAEHNTLAEVSFDLDEDYTLIGTKGARQWTKGISDPTPIRYYLMPDKTYQVDGPHFRGKKPSLSDLLAFGETVVDRDAEENFCNMKHTPITNTAADWHMRTHFGDKRINHLPAVTKNMMLEKGSSLQPMDCTGCVKGKGHIVHSTNDKSEGEKPPPGVALGMDLDIYRIKSGRGHTNAQVIKDRGSGYVWTFYNKNKKSITMIENLKTVCDENVRLRGREYAELRVDPGSEFVNENMFAFCASRGISLEVTPVGPEGHAMTKVEPTIGVIQRSASAYIHFANVNINQWDYAHAQATKIYNLGTEEETPSQTRYEVHHGCVPDLSDLRVMFCIVWYTPHGKIPKMHPRSRRGIYLGCAFDGYRGFLVRDIEYGNIIRVQHVITNEREFLHSRYPQPTLDSEEADDGPDVEDKDVEEPEPIAESEPLIVPTPAGVPIANEVPQDLPRPAEELIANKVSQQLGPLIKDADSKSEVELSESNSDSDSYEDYEPSEDTPESNNDASTLMLSSVNFRKITEDCTLKTPTSLKQILKFEQEEKSPWLDSLEVEYNGVVKNDVVSFEAVPNRIKIVPTTVLYKIKVDEKGELDKRKCRLIALGNKQEFGTFNETSSPTAGLDTVRLFTAISVLNRVKNDHLDAPTAYFQSNEIVDDEVYVQIPPGFNDYLETETSDPSLRIKKKELLVSLRELSENLKPNEKIVIRARKGIPGLKQSGFKWHQRVHDDLLKIGYRRSKVDPCLYFKSHPNNQYTYIIVYVDDFISGGSTDALRDVESDKLVKLYGCTKKEMKHFLGMAFDYSKNGDRCTISIENNILEFIDEYGMSDCKPVSTPSMITAKLSSDDCTVEGQEKPDFPMKSFCGKALWITRTCRPDCYFAVVQLCRFTDNFGTEHVKAAKHLLRYLKGTSSLGITYSANGFIGKDGYNFPNLHAYADAEFATFDIDQRRSIGGLFIMLANGPIAWKNEMHARTSGSTAVAEYYTLSRCGERVQCIREHFLELLAAMGYPADIVATPIFEDNMTCIKIANRECDRKNTKHIQIRYHIIQDMVEFGEVRICKLDTKFMVADLMNKAQPTKRHEFLSAVCRGDLNRLVESMSIAEREEFYGHFS